MAIAEVRPIEVQLAVRDFWLYEGRSFYKLGEAHGISNKGFEKRVRRGHEMLKPIFARQAERRSKAEVDGETVLEALANGGRLAKFA